MSDFMQWLKGAGIDPLSKEWGIAKAAYEEGQRSKQSFIDAHNARMDAECNSKNLDSCGFLRRKGQVCSVCPRLRKIRDTNNG